LLRSYHLELQGNSVSLLYSDVERQQPSRVDDGKAYLTAAIANVLQYIQKMFFPQNTKQK